MGPTGPSSRTGTSGWRPSFGADPAVGAVTAAALRKIVSSDQQQDRTLRTAAVMILSFIASPVLARDPVLAQARDYPILDVHIHAHRSPPQRSYCALSGRIGVLDEDGEPVCDDPLAPARDGADLMTRTLAYLEAYDMYAVAMTQDFAQIEAWMGQSDRIFASIQTGVADFETNDVRTLVEAGKVIAIGELMTQYEGISPDSEAVNEIWELAVEHDVPVGIHMSAPDAQLPSYVARFGNPLLLEPVLERYPDLRVYLMHAGWPFLEETVSILGNRGSTVPLGEPKARHLPSERGEVLQIERRAPTKSLRRASGNDGAPLRAQGRPLRGRGAGRGEGLTGVG